jgi:glycosyltransferase involved in cell wall biosynthesis
LSSNNRQSNADSVHSNDCTIPFWQDEGSAATPRCSVSVVIPAYNSERTIGVVVRALRMQRGLPTEIIVVDDGSTDETGAVAARHGARVIRTEGRGFAGGARNRGWDAATGDVVVFLDADSVPEPGWGLGLARALAEFPGTIIGCARTFTARTAWGWVGYLQSETPYLPLGSPRRVAFVCSYCMAVPRHAPWRWDASYGGEDGIFCVDALRAGFDVIFDPRFETRHEHEKDSFSSLRRHHDRLAYSIARVGPVQREARRKRLLARMPLHYFALARLVWIYRRLSGLPEYRARMIRVLPRMVIAEWSLGTFALRYAVRLPPRRGQGGSGFR